MCSAQCWPGEDGARSEGSFWTLPSVQGALTTGASGRGEFYLLVGRASGEEDEGREGLLPVHLAFIMQFWTSERQCICS